MKSQEESESSVATTSFGDIYAPNPNNPPLTTGDFDPGHRVAINASYMIPITHGTTATVSMFYSGQSGLPYTLSWNGDANNDGIAFNDNLYLFPANSTIALTGGTYQNFMTFLQSLGNCATSQVGQIFARNSCRAPWSNTLNARIAIGLPFKKVHTDFTIDIFNLLDLLNDHWGLQQFANFNQIDVIRPTVSTTTAVVNGITTATGSTLTGANLATINPTTGLFNAFSIDDLRSRWQFQLGLKVSF